MGGLALLALVAGPAVAQSALRRVVPSKTGGGWALWASWDTFTTCTRATILGTPADERMFCTDGVAGAKPRVGELAPGTLVERLESRTCREMVTIRVGEGPLKGETGRISANALTSTKPE